MADELFEMLGIGKLKVQIAQRYSLSEAAEAQRKLAAGETTGSTILLP
jgi:NADPH2:quinone reductase